IIGIDYYPRYAVQAIGSKSLYFDGSASQWQTRKMKRLFARAIAGGQQVMITEGQAEPWETVTVPPNPIGHAMSSCLPEHVITNYNTCMYLSAPEACFFAYLFWGAEYWLHRQMSGDPSYLHVFSRILDES